jgi:hypothetical protein
MKIPAPMIPPMTAIVVPNNPSCRANPRDGCFSEEVGAVVISRASRSSWTIYLGFF